MGIHESLIVCARNEPKGKRFQRKFSGRFGESCEDAHTSRDAVCADRAKWKKRRALGSSIACVSMQAANLLSNQNDQKPREFPEFFVLIEADASEAPKRSRSSSVERDESFASPCKSMTVVTTDWMRCSRVRQRRSSPSRTRSIFAHHDEGSIATFARSCRKRVRRVRKPLTISWKT